MNALAPTQDAARLKQMCQAIINDIEAGKVVVDFRWEVQDTADKRFVSMSFVIQP